MASLVMRDLGQHEGHRAPFCTFSLPHTLPSLLPEGDLPLVGWTWAATLAQHHWPKEGKLLGHRAQGMFSHQGWFPGTYK